MSGPDPTILQKEALSAASFPEDDIYCTLGLNPIFLKPITKTQPDWWYEQPWVKRDAAARRARWLRRHTFKRRMRHRWHQKKLHRAWWV